MKIKLPKFLLCQNPIAEKSVGRIFILHTREPVLLAEVFRFDSEDEIKQMECKKLYTVGASLDFPPDYFVFGAVWIEKILSEKDSEGLPGLMRRMADWYEAYLISTKK